MFDWIEYFDLACSLAQREDEASQRSAVSRAYYAAFCSARNKLRREGLQIPETGEAHRLVWERYESHTDKDRRSIGQNGKRLKRQRTKVDYDDEVERLDQVVKDAMTKAEHLISILRSL